MWWSSDFDVGVVGSVHYYWRAANGCLLTNPNVIVGWQNSTVRVNPDLVSSNFLLHYFDAVVVVGVV